MSAAKHGLSNLVAIVDYNKIQSAGTTAEILELEPLADKWRAFGFATVEVDGHDVAALQRLFSKLPMNAKKPTAVIAHSVKGKGFPFAEHDPSWHHKSKIPPELAQDLTSALEAS